MRLAGRQAVGESTGRGAMGSCGCVVKSMPALQACVCVCGACMHACMHAPSCTHLTHAHLPLSCLPLCPPLRTCVQVHEATAELTANMAREHCVCMTFVRDAFGYVFTPRQASSSCRGGGVPFCMVGVLVGCVCVFAVCVSAWQRGIQAAGGARGVSSFSWDGGIRHEPSGYPAPRALMLPEPATPSPSLSSRPALSCRPSSLPLS